MDEFEHRKLQRLKRQLRCGFEYRLKVVTRR